MEPTYKVIEHYKSNREVRRVRYKKAGITYQVVRNTPRDVDEKREYRQIKKLARSVGMSVEDWKTMRSILLSNPGNVTS